MHSQTLYGNIFSYLFSRACPDKYNVVTAPFDGEIPVKSLLPVPSSQQQKQNIRIIWDVTIPTLQFGAARIRVRELAREKESFGLCPTTAEDSVVCARGLSGCLRMNHLRYDLCRARERMRSMNFSVSPGRCRMNIAQAIMLLVSLYMRRNFPLVRLFCVPSFNA